MFKKLVWRKSNGWELVMVDQNGDLLDEYIAFIPYGVPNYSRFWLPGNHKKFVVDYATVKEAKRDLLDNLTVMWCYD